jgi:hypothetical protein
MFLAEKDLGAVRILAARAHFTKILVRVSISRLTELSDIRSKEPDKVESSFPKNL